MTREEAIDWLARVRSNTVNHTLDMPLWWNEPLAEALEMAIKALEQEPRWIPVSERLPEGATNGDMIKAMFPNIEIEGIGGITGLECVAVSIGLGTSYFALDWWNAPYKAESEEV